MNQTESRLIDSGTILIVDDDPSLRDILSKTLSMENFQVEIAEDGNHALEILQNNKDIVLLLSDVQMQPMNGHELLKNCKKLFPDMAVILMTAYGTIENAVNAMHDGAVDYLVKPFEYSTLIEMVEPDNQLHHHALHLLHFLWCHTLSLK